MTTRLTHRQMDELLASIAVAPTPIDALIEALRRTFIALGAGDFLSDECEGIDGSEWPLDSAQWEAICDALINYGKHQSPSARVNLGLDWMNKGPSGVPA